MLYEVITPTPPADGDTATVRRIAARLERLPPDEARYLAAFARATLQLQDTELNAPEAGVVQSYNFV